MSGQIPLRGEIEEMLYREARLLDERRFEEWLALFTPDARYWWPGGDGDDPAVEASIVDDDHGTLEDRVQRLRSPATYAQSPPSRTLHVVTNIEVEPSGSEVLVHSTCVVHESRLGETRAVATRCQHRLRLAETGDGTWRIASKQVRLLNLDQPLYNLTFLI